MPKIALVGAKGKMGTRIASLIAKSSDLRVEAFIDKGDILSKHIEKMDVVVDFSLPDVTIESTKTSKEFKKPMVIGTTGLTDKQEQIIKTASKVIPIVYSPNMSIGVNLVLLLIEKAAKAIGNDFTVDIFETHHIHKADKPSGTAKKMAEVVFSSLKAKTSLFEESMPERSSDIKDIRICSVRKDEVVGEHEIKFSNPFEEIRISHSAKTRDVFAFGAIAAVRWILGRPAGLYTMKDVLGL